jgi:hypothetical protein
VPVGDTEVALMRMHTMSKTNDLLNRMVQDITDFVLSNTEFGKKAYEVASTRHAEPHPDDDQASADFEDKITAVKLQAIQMYLDQNREVEEKGERFKDLLDPSNKESLTSTI